jgi:hypothetical protein
MRSLGLVFGLIAVLGAAALIGFGFITAGAVTDSGGDDTGWVIRSLDVDVAVGQTGVLDVTEDVLVDFGPLQRHGIFRDIPYLYRYEPEPGVDSGKDRQITITNVSVDDGNERPVTSVTSFSGANLRVKIGDAAVYVTGEQRYRIHYTVHGALNPLDTHDELFWNATGNDWPVPIESSTANVTLPVGAIFIVDCYEGETGSRDACAADFTAGTAEFTSRQSLPAGSGMTFVLALEKGAIEVPPLVLVPHVGAPDPLAEAKDFLGPSPAILAFGAFFSVGVVGLVAYEWWRIGRDRWYGDTYYLTEGAPAEETRPPLAHQTVVVNYTPPDVLGAEGRRLRPAEIGLLLDERADTLDVSATIVDLAVRKHLAIRETPKGGVFGIFQGPDYMLEKLAAPEDDLLPYERTLIDALFETGDTVKLSDLKNKFHEDLEKVKKLLYKDVVKLKLFPSSPDTVRNEYMGYGVGVIVVGALLGAALGYWGGSALLALPVMVGGVALMLMSPAMPRRSASGWETYRRCLGFRLYMVTAETDRQKFAEQENIFHEYLPYAIVMGCVDKWAKAFEGLELQPDYYVGTRPFIAADFASGVNSFSTSVGSVMASTPGASGGSGFSGGGGSGGGVGGGGGGSW